MSSTFVSLFCKQTTCPSSEMLLCYRVGDLSKEQSTWIAQHLCACEFCGAELQLLNEYRSVEEEYQVADMPLHLRHLAEALLSRDLSRVEIYSEAAYEKVPMTLTDA
ncbi:MAG TPA: hypothetical protein VF735_18180 [Pyrinomonadaceae bacterium]